MTSQSEASNEWLIQTSDPDGVDSAWWGGPHLVGSDLRLEGLTNSKPVAKRYKDHASAHAAAKRLSQHGHINQYEIVPADRPSGGAVSRD